MKLRPICKVLISLWIVFHLSVMIFMANGASYFARSLGPVYRYYSNQLNLNVNWNFFSPDPSHVIYLRYVLYYLDAGEQDLREPEEKFFPVERNLGNFGLKTRRNYYLMRYLLFNDERVERLLVPYLCRQSQASKVLIQTMGEMVPTLEQVDGGKDAASFESVKYFQSEFDCRSESK